jgi:hypothetical protein
MTKNTFSNFLSKPSEKTQKFTRLFVILSLYIMGYLMFGVKITGKCGDSPFCGDWSEVFYGFIIILIAPILMHAAKRAIVLKKFTNVIFFIMAYIAAVGAIYFMMRIFGTELTYLTTFFVYGLFNYVLVFKQGLMMPFYFKALCLSAAVFLIFIWSGGCFLIT